MFDFYDSDDTDEPEEGPDAFDLTDAANVSCPYCGEPLELGVDPAGGELQEYVEDCVVCCQPMSVRVHVDRDGAPSVSVDTLDGE
ncbi:MAG: CPXCG motif-containing cysteine-rich protein [Gemmatimonadota bacterium]